MKKIAIISEFNRTNVNYGNRLQAMALNQYLIKTFPEYKFEYLYFTFWDVFKCTKPKNLQQQINDILNGIKSRIYRKIFTVKGIESRLLVCDRFSLNNMTLVKSPLSWNELLESDYDVFIVGSDVVWAQGVGKVGKLRFLDFDTQKKYDRIAYAASFGRDWIPEENINTIYECLSKFKGVSVREKSTVNFLANLGINSVHVVDPTLLLNSDEWGVFEKPVVGVKDRYVFTYLLGTEAKMRKDIEGWAKSLDLKIATIPYAVGERNKVDDEFGDYRVMDCSPENWLWLIHHAEYVITDSFHGSVFSTIYKKKLIVLERISTVNINNRMVDFMKMIQQSDKIISSNSLSLVKDFEWNYKPSQVILDKEIEFSKNYLKNML